jgi:hypothetical protein
MTRIEVPFVALPSSNEVMGLLQAALRKLTGGTGALTETKRQVSVEEIPDDRPTQTSGTRYVDQVQLGDRAVFRSVVEVGGWCQGTAFWSTDDFAGTGRLGLTFESGVAVIEAAAPVAELFAELLRQGTKQG